MLMRDATDSFLKKWFACSAGMSVLHELSKELEKISCFLNQTTALQLGFESHEAFNFLPFRSHWIITPSRFSYTHLQASFEHLPFAKHTIDCIIMPFSNVNCPMNDAFIKEIDSILKPGGYLIFWGVNPYSCWGYWFYTQKKRHYFEQFNFFTAGALLRKMKCYAYNMSFLSYFYHLPPLNSLWLLENLKAAHGLGKLFSPLPAGFFCLMVQKKIIQHQIDFQKNQAYMTLLETGFF